MIRLSDTDAHQFRLGTSSKRSNSTNGIGRCLNTIFASVMLFVLLPLLVVVVSLIVLIDGKPVMFAQQRIGLAGKRFTIYKFRTLGQFKAQPELREDDPYNSDWNAVKSSGTYQMATSLGKLLRRFRFDELPQLLNVIKGNMSLVGPRPYVMEDMSNLGPTHTFRLRHTVLPGVTGLAQTCGNNLFTEAEKYALDLVYVQQRSLMLDMRILLATLPATILGDQWAYDRFHALNSIDLTKFSLSLELNTVG